MYDLDLLGAVQSMVVEGVSEYFGYDKSPVIKVDNFTSYVLCEYSNSLIVKVNTMGKTGTITSMRTVDLLNINTTIEEVVNVILNHNDALERDRRLF